MRLKGQGVRVTGGIAFWRGFRPQVKAAEPGIRIGGRRQYNWPTFCYFVLFVVRMLDDF